MFWLFVTRCEIASPGWGCPALKAQHGIPAAKAPVRAAGTLAWADLTATPAPFRIRRVLYRLWLRLRLMDQRLVRTRRPVNILYAYLLNQPIKQYYVVSPDIQSRVSRQSLSEAASIHSFLSHGHGGSCARIHFKVSSCPCQAASSHTCEAQAHGGSCDRIHFNVSIRPSLAAAAHARESQSHQWSGARIHFKVSRCPFLAAR
jgi:hypothetical protein